MVKRNIAGEKIREARLKEIPRATHGDLSARLEILGVTLSVSSIGRIENGERAVTDIQLVAFAKALHVSIQWLVGE